MGLSLLDARQPVNADCAACGIAPELDELLDGEDASQVLDRSAVLSTAASELVVSQGARAVFLKQPLYASLFLGVHIIRGQSIHVRVTGIEKDQVLHAIILDILPE